MMRRKILITEDELLVALDLQQRLNSLGFDVPAIASSGEEAVRHAAEFRPDLVLMDVMLQGGGDGIEAARRIRERSDVPVIYLTANADSQTLKRAQETEASSYLLKPFRERELQISIEMALNNHDLKRQLRRANDDLENRVRARTAELDAANRSLQKAERAASEWKERYDLIVTSSGLAIYDVDRVTGRVIWGSGAERILGQSTTALNRAADGWLELVHPEDRAEVIRSLRAGLLAGFSFELHYRLRCNNGRYLWISDRGFFIRDTAGRCVRVIGMMQDITQRKATEDKLREQATLLDKTHDAIMVRDLEDRILYWNSSAERLYGWTTNEAVGHPVHELLLRGELGHIPEARATAFQSGDWSGEVTVFTKSGKRLIVHSRWTLLRDQSGNPNAFLVAHTDLTERKLLEEKYLRAQRLESVGALASGIAHDLNNVFTPILMSVQMLEENLDQSTRENILQLLHSSARRGSDMVKQVLLFTRGAEGAAGPVQLKHLLGEVGNMIRDTFARDIKLEVEISRDLWSVPGDATQLYQVLMNLTINARDAMPDGGVLKIRAHNEELDSKGDFRCRQAGPYVCIAVSDTGIGMTLDIQKRVFEPFFTTKEPGCGTGLGLSTVQTIVSTHKGFVELESQPGAGTQFRVFLPADKTLTCDESAIEANPPEGNGELLLVVDDESAIREVIKATLEAQGYDVLLASEGTEALALYATHRDRIALVITDMIMPFMNGPATIRALRKLNPSVKVLAVTGAIDNKKIETFATAESIPLVKKPYSPRALLTRIALLLHEQSSGGP